MNITLTGGTGFIGSALVSHLLEQGHSVTVLSRSMNTELSPEVRTVLWDSAQGEPPAEALSGADAVIHLAGEPVAQRWTYDAKRRIRSTRVDGTRFLIQALSVASPRPKMMVSASAIGYYGDRGDEILTETSPPGSGWLAGVARDWEGAADFAKALGIRLVKLRIGVVLGPGGGVLGRMSGPFRWGMGGRLGSGTQWMSWIHLHDLVGLIDHALQRPDAEGVWNATSPEPVRNAEFTEVLATTLRRPALVAVPAFALRLVLGEMSEVLLASQRAVPIGPLAAGFTFRHPTLPSALRDTLA
jgi:uncharacterized protein